MHALAKTTYDDSCRFRFKAQDITPLGEDEMPWVLALAQVYLLRKDSMQRLSKYLTLSFVENRAGEFYLLAGMNKNRATCVAVA